MNDIAPWFSLYYYTLGVSTRAKHELAVRLGTDDDPLSTINPSEVLRANHLVAKQVVEGASFPGWNIDYAKGYLGLTGELEYAE